MIKNIAFGGVIDNAAIKEIQLQHKVGQITDFTDVNRLDIVTQNTAPSGSSPDIQRYLIVNKSESNTNIAYAYQINGIRPIEVNTGNGVTSLSGRLSIEV